MTNYNHSRFLKYSVNAVLEQSYQPMEFIILDNCSTDNSIDVLTEYADNYPIFKIVSNKNNRGVDYSVNRSLKMSQGNYNYGAAADDMILPGFIEKTMELFGKYPEAALCSTLPLM